MGMQMKQREQYLRVVNTKLVYLTSRAALSLGDRFDVYEHGRVTALVSGPLGMFYAGHKSANCGGRNICSGELAAYLCQKYGVDVGGRLPVWTVPEDTGVLYLGFGELPERGFCRTDGRFSKVELDYRRRYGDWVFIEDNCVSFTEGVRRALPRRLALYGDAHALALLGDPDGPYILEYRAGRKGDAVYNRRLAEYCKARFGGSGRSILLHASILEGGVVFSSGEDALPRPDRPYAPPPIDLGRPRDWFISLLKNQNSIYLSAQCAKVMGTRLNAYAAGGFLAFRREQAGPLEVRRVQYQHLLRSKSVHDEIVRRYPGERRLYLRPHGDLLVLIGEGGETDGIPSPDRFCRLEAGGERRGKAPEP